jgi:hypothetical protein
MRALGTLGTLSAALGMLSAGGVDALELGPPVYDSGREWLPVVNIRGSNSLHLMKPETPYKFSDVHINALRGSYRTSMLWLKCAECSAYVTQNREWSSNALTDAADQAIEYCSGAAQGPFVSSKYTGSNVHHGVDCYAKRAVYGHSLSYEVDNTHVAQNGCWCDGVGGLDGMLYVSPAPELGATAEIQKHGRSWIPVVNIPATSTNHVSNSLTQDKLSDVSINALRLNFLSSVLWLQCGECNGFVRQNRPFTANGDSAHHDRMDICATSAAGPFLDAALRPDLQNLHRGIDCFEYSMRLVYQEGSVPGCMCDGQGWMPGTLFVSPGPTIAPSPAPTPVSLQHLGIGGRVHDNGVTWVPVVNIVDSNIDHLITSSTDYKLADSVIDQLRGDYNTSVFWLECGTCSSYSTSSQPWVSDQMVTNDLCSASPAGPFTSSSQLDPEILRGIHCSDANQNITYQYRSKPGCACNGEFAHTGTLYVKYKAQTSAPTAYPTPNIPQDCVVDSWTDWSTCSSPCSSGVQKQYRSVSTEPEDGGLPCPTLEDPRNCNEVACASSCPAESEFDAMWSACTKTCGKGTQSRLLRSITTGNQVTSVPDGCTAQLDRVCNANACPTPYPTAQPTMAPTQDPTGYPTRSPTAQTGAPTMDPTKFPTSEPTLAPSLAPTPVPTPSLVPGGVANISCVVDEYDAFGPCDRTCGGGSRIEHRGILVHQSGSGDPCPSLAKVENCGMDDCPEDCVEGQWGSWSTCSEPCIQRDALGVQIGANGTMNRTRIMLSQPLYNGRPCGASNMTKPCGTEECPRDCVVTDWDYEGDAWITAPCSKTCGDGVQTRKRQLVSHAAHGGASCPDLIETAHCNSKHCPTDCELTDYGLWSTCTKTCGTGNSTRSRTVTQSGLHGGLVCPTLLSETADCNTTPCAVDCETSDYSAWSSCSKSCGTVDNLRTRSQSIIQAAAHDGTPCPTDLALTETEACPTTNAVCPVDCVIDSWANAVCDSCTKSCGNGTKTCNVTVLTQPVGAGKKCDPVTMTGIVCGAEPCPVDCVVGEWNYTHECSNSCNSGLEVADRAIITQPSAGGKQCPDLFKYNQCAGDPCPQDCVVSEWSEWTQCSANCGVGYTSRSRNITSEPLHGGKLCPTFLFETGVSCNAHECRK